ncbi:SMIM5 protein, partial [Pachycephala philippinensis]|nr:SMIM5 protein [Pachycephala philippinensis]
MSPEDFLKEVQAIGEKFLLKLQKLPKADPVEIASFSVVLLFIATVLVLTIIACSCCCYSCCGCDGGPDPRHKRSRVRPDSC